MSKKGCIKTMIYTVPTVNVYKNKCIIAYMIIAMII